MKKLLIFISILFLTVSIKAQFQSLWQGNPLQLVGQKGAVGSGTGYYFLHNFPDTASANLSYQGVFINTMPNFLIFVGTTLYVRNAAATKWEIQGGSGTVTSFSSGNLSPLFTTSVATSTSTPALSFAQVSQNQNLFFGSPNGSAGNPTFRAIVTADLPELNLVAWKTTGNAGTVAGTNFVGTTDAVALWLNTNSVNRLIIPSTGIASSTASTDSVLVTKTDGVTMGKIAKSALLAGVTASNGLTAASNNVKLGGLLVNNTEVNGDDTYGMTFENMTVYQVFAYGATGGITHVVANGSFIESGIYIHPDSILLKPQTGFLKIDTLLNSTEQDVLMGWTTTADANRGKVGYITLDSKLLLSSGVLGFANAAGGTVFGRSAGTTGAPAYTSTPVLGIAGTTLGTLGFAGNTSGTVTIQAAAAAGTWTWTIPTTDGNADEFLQTNGSGVTSWQPAPVTLTNTVTLTNKNIQLTIVTKTASDTLELTDAGKDIEMNLAGANNLSVPANADVAFPIGTQIVITQLGAGQTTLVALAGVTINSSGGKLKITDQYSGATLIKRDTNTWVLFGNLSL